MLHLLTSTVGEGQLVSGSPDVVIGTEVLGGRVHHEGVAGVAREHAVHALLAFSARAFTVDWRLRVLARVD